MAKILFLADINSAHTSKWALSLAAKGFQISIFSLNKAKTNWFLGNTNIEYLSDSIATEVASKKEAGKISYIKAVGPLKKVIKSFKPDIVHAHYASSYGLLGALSGFHPLITSVWGSDVYEFPKKSFLHKLLFKRNLKKADCVLSTSQSMTTEIAKYTASKVEVTPFGIDIDVFKPMKVKSLFNEGDIIVGTIKSLEPIYGIQYLIEAFDILCHKHTDLPLKLLIVGGGSQETNLKQLCAMSGLKDKVIFTGPVDFKEVPAYHNMLDVYVALSESESFGVAVLEASACGKPVVVSNVSGLTEIVENGTTGIIVPRRNAKVAATAIEKLIKDKEYALKMGENGRKRVEELYNWSNNINDIVQIYNTVLNR